MNDRVRLCVVAVTFTLFSQALISAQDDTTEPEDPAHDEIRTLRDEALRAYRDKDIDKLLTYLHPNVAVTLQNAEVLRGHQAVRAFHERMSVGENREVISVTSTFTVDDLATLYGGDTAVAVGSMNDEFQLKGGMNFSLDSRWTATLVKEDGRWLVSAFQASTNMFDNGVSRLMQWWNTVKVGAISGTIGLLVGGLVVAWLRGKRKHG